MCQEESVPFNQLTEDSSIALKQEQWGTWTEKDKTSRQVMLLSVLHIPYVLQ